MRVWLAVAAAVLVYANALPNPYLWDDVDQIERNHALSVPQNAAKLFSSRYYDVAREESYRPVKMATFFATAPALGLGPSAQRAVNIGLHAANTYLVYGLAAAWVGTGGALPAALIFAVHPVHAEAVDCVSYRDELLACLFLLLALLALERRRPRIALAAFAVALLSKENAVILPLLLAGKWFIADETRKDEQKTFLISSSVLAGAYLALRFLILPNPEQQAVYPGGGFFTNLLTMSQAAIGYVRLLVWPSFLSVSYDVPTLTSPLDSRFLLSFGLLAALAAAAWKLRERSPLGAFLIFWPAAALLPVLNLVPFLLFSLVFERYLYIPSVGFCLLAGLALSKLPRKALLPLTVVLAAACAWRTVERNADWRDAESLYAPVLKAYPDHFATYVFLGRSRMEMGNLDGAIPLLEKSLTLSPSYYSAHNALGAALFKKGDIAAAIEHFQQALVVRPGYVEAWNNLAVAQFESGRPQPAETAVRKALALKPFDLNSHENLTVFLVRQGKAEEAVQTANAALALGLRSPSLYAYLGMALSRKGLPEQAIPHFQAALDLAPNDPALHDYLGVTYASLRRDEEAVVEFKKALALAPGYAPARKNLAQVELR